MNLDLLRNWLALPPGPWPPDDRALLGVPAGPISAMDVEQRALGQMEKLRPHQLVHPDLVTEGMNRLAQAMISLIEEANRAAQQSKLERERQRTAANDIVLDADVLAGKSAQPVVLEAEVVSVPRMLEKRPPAKPRPPKLKKPKKKKKKPKPALPGVDVPNVEPVPPGATYSPAERRKGYGELVAMRRVLKAWEKLQPYFSVPSEDLATPATVFGFVESVREARRTVAVDADRAWFVEHGQLVLTLVSNQHALPIFRNLVLTQRQQLATDWAYATAHLRSRYLGLREGMRESKPRKAVGVSARKGIAWLRRNPEWVMAVLIVTAVVIAFVRSVSRGPAADG
jgi:hypothetical protein